MNKQIIINNSFWLIFENITNKIIFFLISIYIARFLGPSDLGLYAFLSSILFFFAIIADFGLAPFMIREVAKNKINSKKFSTLVMTNFIFIILSYIILILMIKLIELNIKTKFLLIVFSFFFIFYIPVNNIRNIFRGYQKTFFDFIINFSINILIIILIIVSFHESLIQIIIAQNLALGIIFFYAIYILKKQYLDIEKIKFQFIIDFKYLKYTLNEIYPLFITILATAIYFKIDIIMLGFLTTNEHIANYNIAYNFIFLLISFITILLEIMYVFMSKKKNFEENLFNNTLNYIFIFLLLSLVFFYLFGNYLILEIFGLNYVISYKILNILLLSLIFWTFNKFFSYYLNTKHKQKVFTYFIIIGSIFNIIFNFIFIPKYFEIGAAYVTVFTEILIYILSIIYIVRNKIKLDKKIIYLFFIFIIFLIVEITENKYYLLLIILLLTYLKKEIIKLIEILKEEVFKIINR